MPKLLLIALSFGVTVSILASEKKAEVVSDKPGVWQSLFNGKDLDGWEGYHPDRSIEGWKVEDGILHFSGSSGPATNDLITSQQYGDFVLTFQWKISEGGNSGVLYRAHQGKRSAFFSGIEYQILDNSKHVDGNDPLRSAGSIYAMYRSKEDAFKQPGEWNRSYIFARGNHVEHWVNGVKLLEAEIGSDDWNQRVSLSRHRDVVGWAQNERGHIVLQDHHDEVWFKNIWIRPLDTDGTLEVDDRDLSSEETDVSNEWNYLLDGDLTQWEAFIGVPAVDIAVEWPYKNDNLWDGKPFGLNRDEIDVFNVLDQAGEPVLYITGEIYGGLTTFREYENFHWSLEVKWGEKRWPPREFLLRDSGLLYHCVGEHAGYANAWMRSLEMQIQEGDFGDFYGLGGVGAFISAVSPGSEDSNDIPIYGADGESRFFAHGEQGGNRVRRNADYESPHGEWTLVEVYCIGDTAVHVVNGEPVLVLSGAQFPADQENRQSLKRGKLQIQSEGGEVYYRRVKIRPIDEFPAHISDAIGTLSGQ